LSKWQTAVGGSFPAGITGDNIGVQLRCGMRHHTVHHVTGPSAAEQQRTFPFHEAIVEFWPA